MLSEFLSWDMETGWQQWWAGGLGKESSVSAAAKSLEGSFTMFVFSFLTAFTLLSFFSSSDTFLYSFLIALVATILEAITPHGFDNLTVPIGTSFFYWLLMKFLQENA